MAPKLARIIPDRFASPALFLAAASWGLYWYPLREMEAIGIHGAWSVSYFNLFPALLLLPYVVLNRQDQFRHKRKVLLIAAMTGVGLGFYATSLVLSSVIRATMIFYLTPVWSTIIGALWLSEKLTAARLVAIFCGLVGLWLLLSRTEGSSVPLNIGDLFALVSGMLWGLGAACMKRWPEAPIVAASAAQFLIAVLVCLAMGAWMFPDPAPTVAMLRQAFPLSFLASSLVLLPSIFIIFWASRLVFPGRGGILMMSEVMVSILSASILLPEETLSPVQWAGGIIVLVACLIEVRSHATPN